VTLYLLRHGDAIEIGYDDAERPLSQVGEQQASVVGKFLRASRISLDRIISSPLVRAKQTADLIHDELGTKVCSTSEYLVPGADQRQLIAHIHQLSEASVLLVGHEPQLRTFLSTLVTGTPHAEFALRKGTLASVDIGSPIVPGTGTLRWLLTNDQMRASLRR